VREAGISRRIRLAVLSGAALLLLAGLGRVDAWAPDEPRYLQVAEELRALRHGPSGLVLLRLDDRPYDQKPPLYFWLAAAFGAPAGRVGEGAARLPSALAGIATVALTLSLGTRMLGGRSALLGAALLATVFEFAHLARRVQLDVLLTLLESAALALFWRVDRGLGPRRPQLAALHACLGLAVLTKGPVGFLVPLLVVAAFLASEGRLRELACALPLWALPLSLGPGLAWLAAASAAAPEGFAAGTLGENVVGRFFRGTSHARPFFYYLYQFPLDFLPWTLLAPAVWSAGRRRVFARPAPRAPGAAERRAPGRDAAAERAAIALHGERRGEGVRRAWRFLLAWIGASLCFFSLSGGKRGLYLLPAFPAAALLVADAACRELAGRSSVPRSLGAGLALGAGLLGAAALGAIGAAALAPAERLPGVGRMGLLAFGCAVLATTAAGVAAWVVTRRHGSAALRRLAIPVAGAWAVLLAAFLLLYPALDAGRSPRPIALAAAAATPPGEPVGLVGDRAMLGGLVYYGGRRVVPLRSPESIRSFLAQGGRTLVVKQRKLERVSALTPVREVGRARSGRRTVVVVRAEEAGLSAPGGVR
jgi:4-amino-4-deoxy-L-arabinose transferase-like glycosyltransferase